MHRPPSRSSAVIVAVLLLESTLVLPARAQGLSTERLVEFCRDATSAVWRDIGQWLCPAYIRGLIDGARLQAIHIHGGLLCHRAERASFWI